jgi:hypothetical protein
MRATAGDGGGAARTLARCLPPVVASFHIPKLWGFAPAVVVTMASLDRRPTFMHGMRKSQAVHLASLIAA